MDSETFVQIISNKEPSDGASISDLAPKMSPMPSTRPSLFVPDNSFASDRFPEPAPQQIQNQIQNQIATQSGTRPKAVGSLTAVQVMTVTNNIWLQIKFI